MIHLLNLLRLLVILPSSHSAATTEDSNVVELPFEVDSGFVLIQGEVAGRRGTLLLDLGANPAIQLNEAYFTVRADGEIDTAGHRLTPQPRQIRYSSSTGSLSRGSSSPICP